MKIEKEYDVQEFENKLKQEFENKLKQEIEKCGKCGAICVGIDFLTAQGVVDVLETVASWENKRIEPKDISKKILERDYLENQSRQEILYNAET